MARRRMQAEDLGIAIVWEGHDEHEGASMQINESGQPGESPYDCIPPHVYHVFRYLHNRSQEREGMNQ